MRLRRMSVISVTGSMRTGHTRAQALHAVHDQSVSAWIVSSCKAGGEAGFSGLEADEEFSRAGLNPTVIRPFRSWTTFLGESGLAVAKAGQASSQRPHSMQASRLRSCC